MLPFPRSALLLSSLLVLTTASTGHAQESTAPAQGGSLFGLDEPSFERTFGEAIRRRPPPPTPISSAASLAGNIIELRIFLTDMPGVARGEIVTRGPSTVPVLELTMEEGPVEFRDDGSGPDRVEGDGIFTAQFSFDTAGEFDSLRASLSPTIGVLREPREDILIRRGPRDIVTAAQALRDAERKLPEAFKEARENAQRALRLLEFPDLLSAARAMDIDPATTPFLRIAGPRFDELPRQRFKVDHLFDFPIFPIFPPPAPPVSIDERSLLITATGVVEDATRSFDACSGTGTAGGAWSFGHLMRELAFGTGLTAEEFTQHWLSSWQIPQEANGWPVFDPARAQRLKTVVIDVWRRLSPGGVLSVDYFPARLLAVVNRPDLADRIGYGAAGSAGEGRLVFGLVFKDAASAQCRPINFTVIFEYSIAATTCMDVKAWQQRWKDLDQFALGSPNYNQALESITRAFTDHGSNPGQLPNMSSLNQLRTNEIALDFPWQLREFRLQENGLFDLVTVKQAPHDNFESNATLRIYFGVKEVDILNDRHVVPERFPTILDPFLGAVANAWTSSFFWSAPNLGSLTDPIETRRKFSLGSCNGCHSGETETQFTHIGNEGTREMQNEAWLSGFLKGKTVTVPQSGGRTHHYEDLTERKIAMSDILGRSCFRLLSFQPLPFVH